MDLFATLGMSREASLTLAVAGFALAVLFGIRLVLQRSKAKEEAGLRLTRHDQD